jgi:hypothetical protein
MDTCYVFLGSLALATQPVCFVSTAWGLQPLWQSSAVRQVCQREPDIGTACTNKAISTLEFIKYCLSAKMPYGRNVHECKVIVHGGICIIAAPVLFNDDPTSQQSRSSTAA